MPMFNKGDVVQLKPALGVEPMMTVGDAGMSGHLTCYWFSPAGEPMVYTFPPECLQKANLRE